MKVSIDKDQKNFTRSKKVNIKKSVKKLAEQLIKNNIVTPSQMDDALQHQSFFGCRLDSSLLELTDISERVLLKYISKAYNIKYLTGDELIFADPKAISLFPVKFAIRYEMIPLRIKVKTIYIAVSHLVDDDMIHDLEFMLGMKVKTVAVLECRLMELISKVYKITLDDKFKIILDKINKKNKQLNKENKEKTTAIIEKLFDENPVIQEKATADIIKKSDTAIPYLFKRFPGLTLHKIGNASVDNIENEGKLISLIIEMSLKGRNLIRYLMIKNLVISSDNDNPIKKYFSTVILHKIIPDAFNFSIEQSLFIEANANPKNDNGWNSFYDDTPDEIMLKAFDCIGRNLSNENESVNEASMNFMKTFLKGDMRRYCIRGLKSALLEPFNDKLYNTISAIGELKAFELKDDLLRLLDVKDKLLIISVTEAFDSMYDEKIGNNPKKWKKWFKTKDDD